MFAGLVLQISELLPALMRRSMPLLWLTGWAVSMKASLVFVDLHYHLRDLAFADSAGSIFVRQQSVFYTKKEVFQYVV